MEFIVENSRRLDKFLATHHTKFSRSQWQRLIKDGVIKVNGKTIEKPGWLLEKGDQILILEEKILSQGQKFIIEPEPDIPLEIIYEDKDLAAVNKQPGLLVHPTLSQRRHTLVNALLARYPEMREVGENPLRPGIVHRLDKDTSGVIIAARNQAAFDFLKNQFLKRQMRKKYLALVEGTPKEKEGTISYQIRPSKKNRLRKVAVRNLDTSGKKSVRSAETYYKVLKFFNDYSLVEVWPKTGRTHQIRVHLAAIGHPIVGDRMYGAKKITARRPMLHAASLELNLSSGQRLKLEAETPDDFRELLGNQKAGSLSR